MNYDLSTEYMGVQLKNPIIVGASHMTSTVETIVKIEEAGAGAIVVKSLFEEELQMEQFKMDDRIDEFTERHAEMTSFFPKVEYHGLDKHLLFLEKAVNAVSIPVFASLNAVKMGSWVEYAKAVAETGVSGIEINLYHFNLDMDMSGEDLLKMQLEVVSAIKDAVDLPISVKLTPFYTNTLNAVKRFSAIPVDGLVLFNKIFTPEINIDKQKLSFPHNLSDANESRLPIKYMGLLHGQINASLCASTGFLSSNEIIRALLAGADCVQMVSGLYKNGLESIGQTLSGLTQWMESNDYETLKDFRGLLSKEKLKGTLAYERAQYIDLLNTSNKLFKDYQI